MEEELVEFLKVSELMKSEKMLSQDMKDLDIMDYKVSLMLHFHITVFINTALTTINIQVHISD